MSQGYVQLGLMPHADGDVEEGLGTQPKVTVWTCAEVEENWEEEKVA